MNFLSEQVSISFPNMYLSAPGKVLFIIVYGDKFVIVGADVVIVGADVFIVGAVFFDEFFFVGAGILSQIYYSLQNFILDNSYIACTMKAA